MKKLYVFLAFIGPLMQFGMAILSVFVTDFIDLKTKYGLAEELYLEPAPFAFMIWNFIFLSYISLGFYQLRPALLNDPQWMQARPYIFLSTLGNTIWFLGDFQANLFISLIGFLTMLLTLTKLNNIFSLGQRSPSYAHFWFVKFPISLFYGWISIAFPLGVTLWLMQAFGISGNEVFNPEIWSSMVVIIALGIFGSLYLGHKVSPIYLLAGIWGLFWIFVANRYLGNMILAVTAAFAVFFLVSAWISTQIRTLSMNA